MAYTVQERSSGAYSGILRDEDGNLISGSTLTTLALTLRDKATGRVINSRINQDVLNDNGVTVDSVGNLVWAMSAADNPIIDDALETETHEAIFQWAWDDKVGRHKVEFHVVNLSLPGVLNLIRGDAYLDAQGRAFLFSSSDWPDLTNVDALNFSAKKGASEIAGTVTVTSAGGSAQVIMLEITSAQTSGAVVAPLGSPYRWDIQATYEANNVTLVGGKAIVAEDYAG